MALWGLSPIFRGWKGIKDYINIHFGVELIFLITLLQKDSRKLAENKNNIHFLKKCKLNEIIPNFIKLPKNFDQIKTKNSKYIIKKFELNYLSEIIKSKCKSQKELEKSIKITKEKLSILPLFIYIINLNQIYNERLRAEIHQYQRTTN